jgi:TonB family protein
MSRRYFSLIVPLVLLACGFTLPQQTPEKAAQEAAESWLRLIDAGKYAESWDELAEVAKAKVPKETWEKLHNETTAGDAINGNARKLIRGKSVSSLMGLMDKAGVVLEYENRVNSHSAVGEMIELVNEPGRGWRVAFYLKLTSLCLFDTSPQTESRADLTVDPRPEPVRPGANGVIGAGNDAATDSSSRNTVTVDQRPVPLNAPQPRYTEEARRNRVEGVIIMRVLVGVDGLVKQVRIARGLPDGLDEEAVHAAYQLRFRPAMKDGKPVAFWQSISLEFKLK